MSPGDVAELPEHTIAGSGPETIVFLHGLGGDWTNWQPQLDDFAETHRCISWTLPGYGDSPAIDPMTWSTLADAVVAILDSAGVDAAHVVGLSMGGYIAQQLALDHPSRVDRLVLVATSSAFGRPGDDSFKQQFLALRHEPLDQGKTPADLAPGVVTALLGPAPHADARANCERSMGRITSDAYRQALACLVTWNATDRLAEIGHRTLCIAGDSDSTAPVGSLKRLAEGVNNAELVVIEQCGHLINLERPDEFNQTLRSFLK